MVNETPPADGTGGATSGIAAGLDKGEQTSCNDAEGISTNRKTKQAGRGFRAPLRAAQLCGSPAGTRRRGCPRGRKSKSSRVWHRKPAPTMNPAGEAEFPSHGDGEDATLGH